MSYKTTPRAAAALFALLLLAACGGDDEEDRIDRLASDPAGSFRANCEVFLEHVAARTDWSVSGEWEAKAHTPTPDLVADAEEGSRIGLLKVVLADRSKAETTFRFVFVSVPTYGTWMLKQVGFLDAQGGIQTYVGETDPFYAVSADQGRHPDHPDYIGS